VLIGASGYGEPADRYALLFQVGKHAAPELSPVGPGEHPWPPYQDPVGLADLIGECERAGLLVVDPAGPAGEHDAPTGPHIQPDAVVVQVFVARPDASELHRSLAVDRRGGETLAAHRHAAEYWLWRVAALQQDQEADVHDLLEARHHLLAADDPRQAEAVTQGVCAQLAASGSLEQEASLIRDTLRWLGEQSPRRAGWLDELASIGRRLGWSSLGLIAEQAEPAAAPGPPRDAAQQAAAGRP